MIFDLVKSTDPLLKTKLDKFNFDNPPTNPIELAISLAETMIHNNGIGLAANQVGLPYRVFVLMAEEILVCFNPIIVDTTSEEIYLEEGCLSFPGMLVKRPKSIKIRFTDADRKVYTKSFTGMTARAVLHELDHLDGITFKDRATTYHWQQAKKNK